MFGKHFKNVEKIQRIPGYAVCVCTHETCGHESKAGERSVVIYINTLATMSEFWLYTYCENKLSLNTVQ